MDLSSKLEALFGVMALVFTIAIFLVAYSWTYPQNGYFSLTSFETEPIRTFTILVLIISVLTIVHGFETSFFEMTLGALILVWTVFVLAWFFPGTVSGGHYNFLILIDVGFTHASLLLYGSIGTALEITLAVHGFHRGKKSEEHEPEETK